MSSTDRDTSGRIEQSLRCGVTADNARRGGWSVVFARLLVGLLVLICAEVFSGSSLQIRLWNPWVLLVTYWLYFAHFFFFTTLAVRTGRTSFWSLYLWGILYGLYESWITKVVWSGYNGDGHFVMGSIGPYGLSEMSMALFFHPIMSFILPLAVTCLLCPPLRRFFPDLAWFTGKSTGARVVQGYLVLAFASVMAMNAGGLLNLAVNLTVAIGAMVVLLPLAGPALRSDDGRAVVVFGRAGFVGLCAYLLCLYGIAYFFLRPEGLPSAVVQLFTFVFYALAIAGLCMHVSRAPLERSAVRVKKRELRLVTGLFAALLLLGLALSPLGKNPVLLTFVASNLILWVVLGIVLPIMALAAGARSRLRAIKQAKSQLPGGDSGAVDG